jgi:hypothetical protein
MRNKNLDSKKYLICTLLIAVVFSTMGTSMAYARETAPPQTPPDTTSVSTGDNPVLIATKDNDTSLLDRAQDNSPSSPGDNASLISTLDGQTEDNAPLIAPLAQPDNSTTILGIAVFVAAVAAGAVVVLHYRKKL